MTMKNAARPNIHNKTKKEASRTDRLIILFFGLLAVFFAEGFLYWTVVPFFQMRTYLNYLSKDRIRTIAETEFIFSPYSYAQRVIRYEHLKYMESKELNRGDMPLLDHAMEKMEEMIAREGSDPYQHIRLARAYEKKAALLQEPAYFKKAEEYYKNALTLAPQRQEIYYAYGLSLVRQNRAEEGIAVLKSKPALDPTIPLSYYYLGLAQFNGGEALYEEALTTLETFFEPLNANPDSRVSQAIYQRLLYYFYQKQDRARLFITASRLTQIDPERQARYQQIITFMQQKDQVPRLDFKGNVVQALLE